MILLTILAVLVIIDIVLFANEHYGWSATVTIASLAIAYFFAPEVKAFFASEATVILTKYLPIYIAIGIGTAVAKWMLNAVKFAGKVSDTRKKYDIHITNHPDSLENLTQAERREHFVRYFRDINYGVKIHPVNYHQDNAIVDAITPRAKDNVGRISAWIFQWPIVVISTLVSDFFIRIGKHVAQIFDSALSFVGRSLVARATKDL